MALSDLAFFRELYFQFFDLEQKKISKLLIEARTRIALRRDQNSHLNSPNQAEIDKFAIAQQNVAETPLKLDALSQVFQKNSRTECHETAFSPFCQEPDNTSNRVHFKQQCLASATDRHNLSKLSGTGSQ